jgi:hypothetical protein
MTYVVAAGRPAGAVDGPAAGSGDKSGAGACTVDVLFDGSVFFKTVFILSSSFFPTLLTLSSRASAEAVPRLEAMAVDVQCRWPQFAGRWWCGGVTGRSLPSRLWNLFHSRPIPGTTAAAAAAAAERRKIQAGWY